MFFFFKLRMKHSSIFLISPFLTLIGSWETELVRMRLCLTLLASVPAGSFSLSPIHIWSFLSTDHRPRPSPCHSSSSSLRCLSDRWCDSHGDPVTAQSESQEDKSNRILFAKTGTLSSFCWFVIRSVTLMCFLEL